MQGPSQPSAEVAHYDHNSTLLVQASHMEKPRFKELERCFTSLMGGTVGHKTRDINMGRSEELVRLIPLTKALTIVLMLIPFRPEFLLSML